MSSQEQKKILNHKNGCDPINSEIYWAFEIIWLEKYIPIDALLFTTWNQSLQINNDTKFLKKTLHLSRFPSSLSPLKNFLINFCRIFKHIKWLFNSNFKKKKIGAVLIQNKALCCTDVYSVRFNDCLINWLFQIDIDLTQKMKKTKLTITTVHYTILISIMSGNITLYLPQMTK